MVFSFDEEIVREQFRGIATVDYSVRPAEDGDGTLIFLYSECGST